MTVYRVSHNVPYSTHTKALSQLKPVCLDVCARVYMCVRMSVQKGFREENKIVSSCHSDSPPKGRKGLRKDYVGLTERLEWFIVAEQFNPDQSRFTFKWSSKKSETSK